MAIQIKRGTNDSPSRIEYGGQSPSHTSEAVKSFSSSFDNAIISAELEELLDRLYELSDKLTIYPGGRLISEYRSVLHELLKRAAQGYRIKRDMRWRKTDRKMYITIERANKAMDELEEAFSYEGDKTKALLILEEIKGCLISLLM